YGKEGEVNLRGEEGEYDKKENTITIEKNVVVTTSEGAKLKTEKLVWDAGKQMASTDKDVSVEKDNIYCEGKGAFANPEEKKVRIDKEVKVEIKPKTMITCKGPMELNYENNIAVFYNDVKVEDERGNILADKIEVYFLSGTRQIEKIISYGNVRLSQGENTAYSEEAVYDSPSGKITLKGNPKLVVYPKD
ncbi:MAG: LPS export ABC transporter periplasmic protein LptC, partial [Candidatus Omnitrophica bacterium]|nr:LPS export ABC transporter periplasmic protein LptC [Candidatus Omnitrophota bacterium]